MSELESLGLIRFDDYYHSGRTLGTGHFATVKLAIHKSSNEKCAVKIMNRSDMRIADQRNLAVELKILRMIQHPSIVALREIFGEDTDHGGEVHIVMELMGGGELFDRIVTKEFYSEKEAKIAMKVRVCYVI
jgi:calcium/calmodulin-dependent protein kinase I